ncbi:MAG: exosortase/archaeosortase family protein [Candidatus Marinimicrobia bacterium]|nr:exosortase/archaeosortase family protein [Candidatus Neomarinimicrobiota bacterium]
MRKKHLPLILLSILLIGIYFQVIIELVVQWWDDPNYSHGFLIPLVSGFFVWKARKKLGTLPTQNSNWGLLVLVVGLGLYVVGTAAMEYFSVRFSMVVVVIGLVLYFGGKKFLKTLWFPLVFLAFMIPIPYVIYYSVTFPMQLFSSKLACEFLQLSGLSVMRQGNVIHLPNYSLEVIEACSGLRSLMTLSALGAAMAYMTQKSLVGGVIVFFSSIPIAIGANVFRLVITALGAFLISPKFAEGFLHEASGLVVFLSGLFCLSLVAVAVRQLEKRIVKVE